MKAKRVSSTDLAAYLEGGLTQKGREMLEESLAGDPDAMDELITLSRVISAPAVAVAGMVPPGLVREAVALFSHNKETLFDLVLGIGGGVLEVLRQGSGTELSLAGAEASLRGGRTVAPLLNIRKPFGEVAAWLYIEGTGPATCTIRVQIAGDTGTNGDQLRAEVLKGDRVVASDGIAALQAVFDAIGTGDYAVRLRRGRTILGMISIRIKELQGGYHD